VSDIFLDNQRLQQFDDLPVTLIARSGFIDRHIERPWNVEETVGI